MTPSSPPRILFELRPALEGYAGIPQETRLLFRSLCALGDVQVEGLLQSSVGMLPAALSPAEVAALRADARIERMGRIVMQLDKPRTLQGDLDAALHTIAMALRRTFGGSETLTRFDASHFREYLWQRLFAKSLPAQDYELVTGAGFRVATIPWSAQQICARFTARFGAPVFAQLDTRDFDYMIAETPYPATVSPGTRLIVRYHDAIPLLMPHTINDNAYHHATHYLALRHNVRSGAWFACVSDATRRDLLSVFPEVESRSLTIYNMVSHHYFPEESPPGRVARVIAAHAAGQGVPLPATDGAGEYVLMVSSVEPRKNHLALLSAWEQLRESRFPALKLVVVGGTGWHNEPIMRKFQPWMQRGEALMLKNVAPADLRCLYRHARATVCPSLGEGFDFSGVEAMRSGGAVVASDIPVHREVYADAAEYFDPHSPADLAAAIGNLIDAAHAPRRAELVGLGAVVARRYEPDAVLPRWAEFLRSCGVGA